MANTDLTLILLRHAKSDWHSGAADDFARPLNARGRRDAAAMGKYLAENNIAPAVMLASPAERARETAELVRAEWLGDAPNAPDINRDINYERRLYNASPAQIRAIAAARLTRDSRVMIIAHNPGMSETLRAYCPQVKPFADGKLMPTCALAVINFTDGDLTDGRAKLQVLTRPSEL